MGSLVGSLVGSWELLWLVLGSGEVVWSLIEGLIVVVGVGVGRFGGVLA